MKSDEAKAYIYLGGAVVGAYLLYKVATKGTQVAKAVGTALNPADSGNVVNQGVTSIGQALTGDSGWTLGGWIYDLTHVDPFATPEPVEQLASSFTNDQVNKIGSAPALWNPNIVATGNILGGTSFNDMANGNWSYF